MSDVAIKVEGVSKTFKLPHEKQTSVKGLVINAFRGKRTFERQQVLKDISFEIKKGEFFGIVGRNGSGKSTLLKMLAGIYSPDKGHIQVNGKLTPFIELGVGFNPELTGRENVFLNGALLGFNRKEMLAMYDEIVEFAELEKFMDQKLKNYSSGMQVRLAFSIAIRANSEILLLDEVLAVGDEAFQKKCFNYFAQLKKEKRTVILVSHDMESVKRFCNRALLLDSGEIKALESSYKVSQLYSKLNEQQDDYVILPKNKIAKDLYKDATVATRLLNQNGHATHVFNPDDSVIIELEIEAHVELLDAVAGITIEKSNGETIFASTTEHPNESLKSVLKKSDRLKVRYDIQNIFGEDIYAVDTALVSADRSKTYFRQDNAVELRVQNRGSKGWLIHPNYTSKVTEIKN